MTQLVARVSQDLLAELDKLVAAGAFESRSDVVREALLRLIDGRRREEIGRQIVEGYERMPETEEELRWAEQAGREMIAEESW